MSELDSSSLNAQDGCDYFALALPSVRALQPYVPGKPIDELQRELGISDIIKLASNENPLGLSALAVEAIQKNLREGSRYPDGNGYVLKKALVDYYAKKGQSFALNQVTLGNGSNDILELIARAYAGAGDEVVFSEFAFAVYPIATQVVGATAVVVPAKDYCHDLHAMQAAITPRTKLVYLANPNNPTGTAFSKTDFTEFMSHVPVHVVVVLDEAYGEYIEGDKNFPDGLDYLAHYPNLIISRTFSKAWGLASLRVGYAISNAAIADILNRVRQPFNVNHFALVAAAAVLKDDHYLQKSVIVNTQGREQIETGLKKLELNFLPSKGNFVCFNVVPSEARIKVKFDGLDIYRGLLRQGVIVRPVANYGMPDFLRVSIGLPEENARFLLALQSVLQEFV
jgi:histidinol-phosphate aminotransferase